MSGWQVAEKVKSINGRVPVAIITGCNVEIEKGKAIRRKNLQSVSNTVYKVIRKKNQIHKRRHLESEEEDSKEEERNKGKI
jgi:hypothetical protein